MSIHDLHYQLTDLADQELVVEVEGPSVLHIRKGLLDDAAAIDALPDLSALAGESAPMHPPLADVVEIFLRGFNMGLFSSAWDQPRSSLGMLVSDSLDKEQQIKRWHLALTGLHCGTFRVLRNLLRALRPKRVLLRTLQGASTGRSLESLSSLPYPPHSRQVPFQVIRNPTGEKCKAVRLTFHAPLDTNRENDVQAAFNAWAHLLMLGGYLEDDEAERGQIGAAPCPPMILDPFTVEMSFEVFNSDEAALDAAVNLAHYLHQMRAPIESLEFE